MKFKNGSAGKTVGAQPKQLWPPRNKCPEDLNELPRSTRRDS
jgi:hypothetical protein